MTQNQEPLKAHGDKLDPEGRGIDKQQTQRQGMMDPRTGQAEDGSIGKATSRTSPEAASQVAEDQDQDWQRAGGSARK